MKITDELFRLKHLADELVVEQEHAIARARGFRDKVKELWKRVRNENRS